MEILRDLINRKEFWGILGTLLGGLFGYTLNESTRLFRDWRERNRLKDALFDELDTIYYQIEQKKDTLRRMNVALQKKEVLSGMSVPCATAIYSSHFANICKRLGMLERDNIQNIYSRIKLNDQFMLDFESSFKADIKDKMVTDPWKTYEHKLEDIIEDYEVAQELIKGVLEKKPVDIYYRKMKLPINSREFAGKVTPDIIHKQRNA